MVEKAGFRHSRGLCKGVVGQGIQALLIDDLQGGLDELRFFTRAHTWSPSDCL